MFVSDMEMGLFKVSKESLPSPVSVNGLWSLGFLLMVLTVMQDVSGFLMTNFIKVVKVEDFLYIKAYLVKEVQLGWFHYYLHSVMGPSFIFLVMYMHMFKSILFPVFKYGVLWLSGVLMYMLFCGVSFVGYSLGGGSMGYWAFTVMKNMLVSVIGEFGSSLVFYGKVVGEGAFTSLFNYHYLGGLLIMVLVVVHMSFLHLGGSSSFTYSSGDLMGFSMVTFYKDVLIGVLGVFVGGALFGMVEKGVSCESYLPVDSSVVPEEMTPEWYLSLSFMVLSVVSWKGFGIFLMGVTFLILMVLVLWKEGMGSFKVLSYLSLVVMTLLLGVGGTMLQSLSGQLVVLPGLLLVMGLMVLEGLILVEMGMSLLEEVEDSSMVKSNDNK